MIEWRRVKNYGHEEYCDCIALAFVQHHDVTRE